MRKLLIIVIFLAAYNNMFALLTQANWRWRNDNGSETTATWKANQNTQAILTTQGEVWRLRLEVYNNSGNSADLIDSLQYTTDTLGTWTNIDVTAGSNPFKIAGVSAFVTQAQPTTAQLSSGYSYAFVPGKIMVDSMVLKNHTVPDQRRTEYEWAIVATSNIVPNTVYYFRQWGTTANSLDAGMTYPSLVTAGTLPVKFSNFSALREGKKIKLEWSTASQQNTDHFEIERSSDARNWESIAKVDASGASSASNTYIQYDNSPLSGINYYAIKQYDVYGHTFMSEIKVVKISDMTSMLSVYPNPAHSGVNFSLLSGNSSNVRATLSTMSGSIVHQEVFKSLSANSVNNLHFTTMPVPGVYVLKLSGDNGFSESTRVMIQ